MSSTESGPDQDWLRWRAERFAAATDRWGIASLVGTYWPADEPEEIPGAPGLWRRHGGDLEQVGHGTFAPGTEMVHEERLLRVIERDGVPAMRVFDPASPQRAALDRIDAFKPSHDWYVPAHFDRAPNDAVAAVTSVDGHVGGSRLLGTLRVEIGDHNLGPAVTGSPEHPFVVFSSTGDDTYRFRFLPLAPSAVESSGTLTVDFNRIYLPPCAFSDQYLCPLPLPQNRFPIPVRAGERAIVTRETSGGTS